MGRVRIIRMSDRHKLSISRLLAVLKLRNLKIYVSGKNIEYPFYLIQSRMTSPFAIIATAEVIR